MNSLYTNFVVYDRATGRIKRYGSAPTPLVVSQALDSTEGTLQTDARYKSSTYYVVNGVVTLRPVPALSALTVPADGKTTIILSGVADPTTIMIDGNSETVSGGSDQLTFDTAGTYDIEVPEVFPHTALSAQVTAT